jgi:tetratricopeptide (TPR) repeat protein
MSRAVALALALALGLGAPAGAAPPKKPTAAEMRQARAHFQRGLGYHQGGQYDEAVREYEAAFALAELPDLLYNLGQVHRLRGDKAAALAHYQRYIDLAPDGRGVAKAREFAAELAIDLAQESALARSHAEDFVRGAGEGAPRRMPLPPPPPVAVVPRRAPPSPGDAAPPDGGGGRTLRIAGLATGGAGVAALGGAVAFALRGRSLSAEQDDADAYDPDLVARGEAANRNAIICAAIGGAALATGGVLYYLGARRGSEATVVALPERGGVTVWATLPLP